jgi:hypothetical protein
MLAAGAKHSDQLDRYELLARRPLVTPSRSMIRMPARATVALNIY